VDAAALKLWTVIDTGEDGSAICVGGVGDPAGTGFGYNVDDAEYEAVVPGRNSPTRNS
jgi:hypothetical protein